MNLYFSVHPVPKEEYMIHYNMGVMDHKDKVYLIVYMMRLKLNQKNKI
jgi:hypothetical protein